MTQLTVNTSRHYNILVGSELLNRAGVFSREVNSGQKALIVTDSNVAPLYADKAVISFKEAGYQTDTFIFTAGEQNKRLEVISSIYSRLAELGFTRGDLLIALGGGITGDMTGFAAATWLRGIDFVQIPTTLLSQVDSSVGGKTGVDIPEGKNLVGSFWQPALVIADTDTLNTLSDEFLVDGMAEVIKTASIRDMQLFELLENGDALTQAKRERIIACCINIKRGIVERDEHEAGERKLLNFGHTLGHALERYYNYIGITHGCAVAVGMALITAASEKLGLTKQGTSKRLNDLLQLYRLPVNNSAKISEYISGVIMDKKRIGRNIDIVLLNTIGNAYTHSIFTNDLPSFVGIKEETA